MVKGSIFTASFSERQINVEETDYLQVSFKYLSPNYERQDYIVHVIRSDKLADFICEKEGKMKIIYKELSELEGIS